MSCVQSLGEPDCELYGREYPWLAAMKIDYDDLKVYSISAKGDTAFMTKECVDAFWLEENPCDTLFFDVVDSSNGDTYHRNWYSNFADIVEKSKVNSYQGICPDGWRIPTSDDWVSLLRHLGNQYGVGYGDVVPVLITLVLALAPNNKSIESIIIDFPEPVSPVMTVSPFLKSMVMFSIKA